MRGYYVEARDVRQIAESMGMARFDRRTPDHKSVDALIQEMAKLGDKSPILFYRAATVEHKLIVVMQTESMRHAMLKHGQYLLACDTTHDTSRYPGKSFILPFYTDISGILLGTLMTVGAAGEGQPVVFFLVGAESSAELSPVFRCIADR